MLLWKQPKPSSIKQSMKNLLSTYQQPNSLGQIAVFARGITMWLLLLWGGGAWGQYNKQATEKGIPLSRMFNPKQYNAHGQNFAVAQDKRGLMYFGNFAGVLEYDGVSWRTIPTQNITKVSALCVSEFGRVFVGGKGEFGYLKPDSTGTLYFESLSKAIKTSFGQILNIFQTKAGVYFISQEYVFLLTSKGLKEFRVKGTILSSFYENQKIILFLKNGGPQFLEGQNLIPIAKTALTPTLFDLTAVFPLENNEFLLLTSSQGLFKLSNNTIKVFDCEANSHLITNQTTAGTVLRNGQFAIGTLNAGIVIISKNGQIKNQIKDNDYLQNMLVNAMFTNRDGALWLALNNGIVQIDVDSPIEKFNEFSNLKGEVKAVVRANGRLYAGTLNGLFYIDNFNVRPVAALNAGCFDLAVAPNGLLAATNRGLFLVSERGAQQLTPFYSLCVYVSKINPSVIFVGQQNGLGMLNLAGGGRNYRLVGKTNEQIVGITEDEKGNLWLETLSDGVIKINAQTNEEKKYAAKDGLPPLSYNRITNTSKGLIAYNQKGIFRFQPQKDQFEPYNLFQTDSAATVYWNGKILEDGSGKIWTTRGDEKFITSYLPTGQPNKPYQATNTAFLPISDIPFNVIYPDHSNLIWFGGSEGLIRFDLNLSQEYQRPFSALIRKVTVKGEETLFNGYPTDTAAITDNLSVPKIQLEPKNNNIEFEFSAPSFNVNEVLSFQYYLENFDKVWSDWTTQSQKEYTNLPPGNYKFRVRARNIYGKQSEEAIVEFSIATPLYLKWWAIAAYILLIGALIYNSVRWRLRVLVREKLELENLIRERTEEVVTQKVELEQQSEELTTKNDQLEKIDFIVQAINTEINFANLFQTVLNRLKIIRNMDCASALIFNKETNGYQFKALYGFNELSTVESVQLRLEEAENRYIYEAIEVYEDIYFKNDISYEKLNTPIDSLVTPKSMIAIVIKVDNHIEGFITLENSVRSNAFDQRDFNMIKNLKEHLIAAYIKTRILEDLENTLSNLKNTQEELIRQERLASVGQLTKGIVDRILNPLNYINNFSESSTILIDELNELLEKNKASLNQDLQEEFEDSLTLLKNSITKIYDHGNSTTRIVKDMQKLLKEKSREFFETDLNYFIESRAKVIFHDFTQKNRDFNGELLIELEQQSLKTRILPPEFGDVLSNIIDNALYTLFEKSKINKNFSPQIKLTTTLINGEVQLRIKDNGKGIPQRDLNLIFSPFFTTKPTSKGTGLGLFMTKDIIELHKGKIELNSKEGEFTEVIITLPTLS
ncbi:hypothetical protein DR864_28875 (plasmid) [Runella rosea]|uniref:histidine kinase n=2 Tax=Runella rosea TaxID=2259595 RepID=A0A344TTA8_9BACT|nr:hypothetical protein DR864_28875 [Runella rosea]